MTFKIGLIGCGNISSTYLKQNGEFPNIEITACADLDPSRAKTQAHTFGIRACTVEELLADPSISVVLNLTVPHAHAEIARVALEAGKHVYNEKPLAIQQQDADRLLELAASKGLRVGCAPDTFLGAGIQTGIKLIDEGVLGTVVGAHASFLSLGPESWHPNPAFFYGTGAGPLFDMGPYYLTALVALLGPIKRVSGSSRITLAERVIGSGPQQGQLFSVQTMTHCTGILEFDQGPLATFTSSFDVSTEDSATLLIYGTKGTLQLSDPNEFSGPIRLWNTLDERWHDVAVQHTFTGEHRSVGLSEMMYAHVVNREHRASGALARHVLEVMCALLEASQRGQHIEIQNSVLRPAPLPPGKTEACLH